VVRNSRPILGSLQSKIIFPLNFESQEEKIRLSFLMKNIEDELSKNFLRLQNHPISFHSTLKALLTSTLSEKY